MQFITVHIRTSVVFCKYIVLDSEFCGKREGRTNEMEN